MSKTRSEIAQDVLERLGILGAGQSPSSEDQNRVEDIVQAEYEKLRRRGRAPYEISAVPSWADNDLADYIAPRCATLFRIAPNQLQSLLLMRKEAERSMNRETAQQPQHVPMEVKNY